MYMGTAFLLSVSTKIVTDMKIFLKMIDYQIKNSYN